MNECSHPETIFLSLSLFVRKVSVFLIFLSLKPSCPFALAPFEKISPFSDFGFWFFYFFFEDIFLEYFLLFETMIKLFPHETKSMLFSSLLKFSKLNVS